MGRWIAGFLAYGIVLNAQPGSAAFDPISSVEMACGADRIVMGTIVAVNGSQDEAVDYNDPQPRPLPTVDLLVEDQIAGLGAVGEMIQMVQFHNWACARRWESYAVGQKVMVFLYVDHHQNGMLFIMGAGCEGERPIILAPSGERYVSFADPTEHPWWYASYPYAEFRRAIADCRHSFRLVRAANPLIDMGGYNLRVPYESIDQVTSEPAPSSFRRRAPPGTAPKVEPFKNRSATHWVLYQQIEAERREIAKYRGQVERRREIVIAAPQPTVE